MKSVNASRVSCKICVCFPNISACWSCLRSISDITTNKSLSDILKVKESIPLFQHIPCNNYPLNFRSSLVDLGYYGVAHQAFNVVFLYKAVAAMYMHGLNGSAHGYLAGKQFSHRACFGIRQALVFQPGSLQAQQTGSLNFGSHRRGGGGGGRRGGGGV